jgi:hypothetical protein
VQRNRNAAPEKATKRKTYEVKAEVETGTESDKEENSDSD